MIDNSETNQTPIPENSPALIDLVPPKGMNLEEATKFFNENVERIIIYKAIRNDPIDDWEASGDTFGFGFIIRGDTTFSARQEKFENFFSQVYSEEDYQSLFGDFHLSLFPLKDGRCIHVAGSDLAVPNLLSESKIELYKAYDPHSDENPDHETYYRAILNTLKDLVENGKQLEVLSLASQKNNILREVGNSIEMIKIISAWTGKPRFDDNKIRENIAQFQEYIKQGLEKAEQLNDQLQRLKGNPDNPKLPDSK